MPDKRKHRGPHPHDVQLFDRRHWPVLQSATADLCWLLSRGYSQIASVKLVGDRYELRQRQRLAVARSSCSDHQYRNRLAKQRSVDSLKQQVVVIDALNLLTTIEAALAGGFIISGRDGCYRDMASVHGTFRLVEETLPALKLVGDCLAEKQVKHVRWLIDAPVSNSGRLASQMSELAKLNDWFWTVELLPDPDGALKSCSEPIVSADSVVLDECQSWCNLAAYIIGAHSFPGEIVPVFAESALQTSTCNKTKDSLAKLFFWAKRRNV